MTDTSVTADQKPPIKFSVMQAMAAAFIASYCMTQMSLAGVNFEALGFSSEIVKSTIIAHLVTFFGWATPTNIVMAIRSFILWVRKSYRLLRTAAVDGKE